MSNRKPGQFVRRSTDTRTPAEVAAGVPDESQEGAIQDGTTYVNSEGFDEVDDVDQVVHLGATPKLEDMVVTEADIEASTATPKDEDLVMFDGVAMTRNEAVALQAVRDVRAREAEAAAAAAAINNTTKSSATGTTAVPPRAVVFRASRAPRWWASLTCRCQEAVERCSRIRAAFGLGGETAEDNAVKALFVAIVAITVAALLPTTVMTDTGEAPVGLLAMMATVLAVTTLLRGILQTIVDIVAGGFALVELVARVVIDVVVWAFHKVSPKPVYAAD